MVRIDYGRWILQVRRFIGFTEPDQVLIVVVLLVVAVLVR